MIVYMIVCMVKIFVYSQIASKYIILYIIIASKLLLTAGVTTVCKECTNGVG